MDINQMTRAQFNRVPLRRRWDMPVRCRSIVILPRRRMHDSGYRLLDFVAIDHHQQPICRVSGCSDVLHIGGIGGDHLRAPGTGGWNVDCLPKSGLLHLWCDHGTLVCGAALSSFELDVDAVREEDKRKRPEVEVQP
jgi:hypothetical protein